MTGNLDNQDPMNHLRYDIRRACVLLCVSASTFRRVIEPRMRQLGIQPIRDTIGGKSYYTRSMLQTYLNDAIKRTGSTISAPSLRAMRSQAPSRGAVPPPVATAGAPTEGTSNV